ncbi:MAG: hypothetical protein IM631_12345 [Cytophagales bacterium]|nr:hypothetical protein [Cytophagales bacterium]MCA6382305.1 hypothetical protein [Cytophagales bacterium]
MVFTRFSFGSNMSFVLILTVFLSCSSPSAEKVECAGLSDKHSDWLRKRGYSKRVSALPCEKQMEFAKIIQTELDLSDELDSLVIDMNASQKHLPESLKVVVTR